MALLFVLTAFLFFSQVRPSAVKQTASACSVHPVQCGNNGKPAEITYEVQYPNGKLKKQLILKEGCDFIYAMMQAANEDTRFQFSGDYYGGTLTGYFITKINNISQNNINSTYWMFYVNGTESPCGVSSTSIYSNTNYLFKLQKVDLK